MRGVRPGSEGSLQKAYLLSLFSHTACKGTPHTCTHKQAASLSAKLQIVLTALRLRELLLGGDPASGSPQKSNTSNNKTNSSPKGSR
jgi:hypothetical protein